MPPLDELHVYDEAEPVSAAMNMALDEALLEFASVASLRFYRWRRPSLSFGYFGNFADVANEQAHREIVRRWTGGGIVLHGNDLTYSVVLPQRTPAQLHSSQRVYADIHEAIRDSLGQKTNVALAVADAPKISQACFANAVTADVLADGRKIAGAAQRRTRAGLLHQGSIQYEPLPRHFRDAFAKALCPGFVRKVFSRELMERAQMISAQKYATDDWLQRRETRAAA